MVGVALDPELKAPGAVHAGLPKVSLLVVLFRVEGRVSEIAEQVSKLLTEGLLDLGGSFDVAPREALSEDDAHVLVA